MYNTKIRVKERVSKGKPLEIIKQRRSAYEAADAKEGNMQKVKFWQWKPKRDTLPHWDEKRGLWYFVRPLDNCVWRGSRDQMLDVLLMTGHTITYEMRNANGYYDKHTVFGTDELLDAALKNPMGIRQIEGASPEILRAIGEAAMQRIGKMQKELTDAREKFYNNFVK